MKVYDFVVIPSFKRLFEISGFLMDEDLQIEDQAFYEEHLQLHEFLNFNENLIFNGIKFIYYLNNQKIGTLNSNYQIESFENFVNNFYVKMSFSNNTLDYLSLNKNGSEYDDLFLILGISEEDLEDLDFEIYQFNMINGEIVNFLSVDKNFYTYMIDDEYNLSIRTIDKILNRQNYFETYQNKNQIFNRVINKII